MASWCILPFHILQINTESAKLSSDLLLGYNNGTKEIVQKGKGVARVLDRTDKVRVDFLQYYVKVHSFR